MSATHAQRHIWALRPALAALITFAALSTQAQAAEAPGRGVLPDNRAYELISPPQKNGADVSLGIAATRASASGDAVAFDSNGAFDPPVADGSGLPIESAGTVDGTGSAGMTTYISTRSSRAWSLQPITPRQDPHPNAGVSGLAFTLMSSDLSKAVMYAWDPAPAPGGPQRVRNLYVRDNVTGSYTLVSPSSNPIAPNDYGYSPWAAATTPDFHHVLFESYLNLTPETDGLDNPFYRPRLYEWDNGVLHLAGVLPDGSVPDSAGAGNTSGASGRNYTPNTLSSDGSRVFFTSPGDSTGAVYMRVNHSSTVMLNANENAGQTIDCSIQGSCPAAFESATADGSRVLFTSSQQLTDDDPNAAGSDLFVYDTSKPDTDPHNLTRLTRDDEPSDGDDPGVLGVLGTSDDQHYVYFAAIGALVSGQPIAPAEAKLYVWHDGVIRYLATLGSSGYNSDGANWAPGLYNQTPKLSRVTPDGKHLLFVTSASQPGGYDNAGFRELYRYDATAEKSVCVSCDPSGKAAGGNAGIARGVLSGLTSYPYLPRALSQDGSRVFFDTPDALVPGDTNGKNDVYEWSDGEAKLISTGKSGTDSYFADAGADGDDVFFTTKEPLVGWDKDQSRDVYVARVNGGLAEPALLAPPCAGDVCQGDPSVPPAPLDAGSLTFLGSGDLPGVMPVAGTSKPKIAKPKTVKGTSALLSVTVSGRGSVAASGSAVKSARRNAAKAGTVRIAVALTKRARATLTAKHVLKVKVRVVYTPKSGKSSSATAALTFKPSSARKKGRS